MNAEDYAANVAARRTEIQRTEEARRRRWAALTAHGEVTRSPEGWTNYAAGWIASPGARAVCPMTRRSGSMRSGAGPDEPGIPPNRSASTTDLYLPTGHISDSYLYLPSLS